MPSVRRKLGMRSVLERGEENGNLHFHTFIGATNNGLTQRRIKKLWVKLAGFVKFVVIKDELISYTQKTLKDPLHPERVNVRGQPCTFNKMGPRE